MQGDLISPFLFLTIIERLDMVRQATKKVLYQGVRWGGQWGW